VDSLCEVIWRIDSRWRWTYLNRAARNVYGTQPVELIGSSFLDQFASDRRVEARYAFERVFAGAQLLEYEAVVRDHLGRDRYLVFTAHPITDSVGDIVGLQGVARDESPVHNALMALKLARQEAEKSVEAKSALLANMSHEIRTPMNGVLGMIDVLLDSELSADQRRAAELVRTSAGSLLALLNDVLDFSRIEADRLRLEHVSFDLHALVDSVARVMAVNAFEKGVELAYRILPDVPRHFRGDPGRVRQVVGNLLGNAVKFTSEGEVVLTLSVAEQMDDGVSLRFSVRDTGVGIPSGRLESIFEDYTQSSLSTAREYGGAGLGLAISRRLARLMGGDVTVESEPGLGSIFDFTLHGQPESRRLSGATKLRVSFDGLCVLVVGSNSSSREIVCDILNEASIETLEACDAAGALDMLDGGVECSIALIDSYLPGRDGFDLARSIQQQTAGGVRIMVLTSAGQRGDAARCRELGVAAYLTKPVSRSELLEAVARVHSGEPIDVMAGDSELVTKHSIAESRTRMNVLVVEDNPVNQIVANTMLQKRGHQVTVVEDGLSAVEAVTRVSYDVVLMDVQLPGMDGFQATAAIRRIPGKEHLPIVAVTAYGVRGVRERCLDEGFDGFMLKPYRPHELFAAVEGWGLNRADIVVQPSPPRSTSPIDLAALTDTMCEAGVPDAVNEILTVFVNDAPSRMAALNRAAEKQAASSVASAAHVFRSAAATVRAGRLAQILGDLENAARDGALTDATDKIWHAHAELDAVLAFIEDSRVCVGAA